MSDRYKTITFDDFSGGEQCDLIKPTENSFKFSENLVIQKDKVKLGPKIKGGVLYDSGLNPEAHKMDFIYGSYLYLLGSNNVDCFIKKCNIGTGAWTAVDTMDDSGNVARALINFRGLVIANYRNNANDNYLVKYSTNGMTMTTWADTNLVALSGVVNFKIVDYKIIHDRLYILGSDEKLYYSDDGITFILLVALDPSYSYQSLGYLSGYLYVVNVSLDSISGLVRVSLSGEIQDEVISLGTVKYFHHRISGGDSYVLLYSKFLYRVEGDNLVLVFNFENTVIFINSFGIFNSLFFWDYTGKKIIEMDVDEKISRSFSVLGTVQGVISIHKYSASVFASIQHVEEGNAEAAIYENSYIASGNVQTDHAKLKAQGVPKQLVLRHEPLTTNAWVKVYVKVDRAAAWGSAVITSTALNAVKKVYDFPVGTELDFIEFKIEYGTDDSSETPEDAVLDFIYLPTGLANAK